MKKIITLILSLVLVLSLVGCGGKEKKKYNTISWPNSKIAQKLPKPENVSKGEINSDREGRLWIDIAEVSREQYDKYINDLKEKGFVLDYDNMDTESWIRYKAKNSEGYEVRVEYGSEDKEMSIDVFKPEPETVKEIKKEKETEKETVKETEQETVKETEQEAVKETKSEPKKTSGLNPEFKKFMDGYEKFMGKYVEFMKKYKNSNDVTSMLSDYTEIITEYTEYTSKINDINEDELSVEDLNYYNKVNLRVLEKLSEM